MKTHRISICIMMVLLAATVLAGCGGGGTEALRDTFAWLPDRDDNKGTETAASLTLSGTTASGAGAPGLGAPARAINFKSGGYTIAAIDANGERLTLSAAEFTGPESFRVVIPLTTDSYRHGFLSVKTPAGKEIYRKYVGRIPARSAGARSLAGLLVNEESTARAVMALTDRTKMPAISVSSVNLGKTDGEDALDQLIAGAAQKVTELSKVVAAMARIAVIASINSSIKEKVSQTAFSSVGDLLRDYSELAKVSGQITAAGIDLPAQVTIGSATISAGSGTADLQSAIETVRNDFSPLPTVSISELKAVKSAAGQYYITWKTSPAVPLRAKVSIITTTGGESDRQYYETPSSATVDHFVTISATEIPTNILLIRVAYRTADENSPHMDLAASAITSETVQPPPPSEEKLTISALAATKKLTGEYVITWKTNKITAVKAKATFWTTELPNTEDRAFTESQAPSSMDHSLVVPASGGVPSSFVKIRISYQVSEDEGTYGDIPKSAVTIEQPPVEPPVDDGSPLIITELGAAKDASGNYAINWKTSKVTAAKAKITFWTAEMPNTEDKAFTEAAAAQTTSHSLIVPAASAPQNFVKIRISYQISEDEGTFEDILKEEVK